MLHKYLSPLGINAASAYAAAGLSVFLSIGVWIFDKSDDRGTRDRLASAKATDEILSIFQSSGPK